MYRSNWSLSSPGVGNNDHSGVTYEAEDATLLDNTEIISCRRCQSGKAVGGLRSQTSNGIRFPTIKSPGKMRTTITISYVNDSEVGQYALIMVNHQLAQRVAFLPSGGRSAVGIIHEQSNMRTRGLRGVIGAAMIVPEVFTGLVSCWHLWSVKKGFTGGLRLSKSSSIQRRARTTFAFLHGTVFVGKRGLLSSDHRVS
jgi:hypothetical protein